nr:MAG TPA: hypothetical protein [Caudoviricetes sp.]
MPGIFNNLSVSAPRCQLPWHERLPPAGGRCRE